MPSYPSYPSVWTGNLPSTMTEADFADLVGLHPEWHDGGGNPLVGVRIPGEQSLYDAGQLITSATPNNRLPAIWRGGWLGGSSLPAAYELLEELGGTQISDGSESVTWTPSGHNFFYALQGNDGKPPSNVLSLVMIEDVDAGGQWLLPSANYTRPAP